MKKLLLTLFAVLLSFSVCANVNVEIDGIKYSLNENTKEASVINKSPIYSGDIVIPSSVDYSDATYSVTSIYERAFRFCTDLTSVAIPNSVTSIGHDVFRDCSGLTSIDIPNSVISIGASAFRGCTGLTSIKIPNSVTYIDNYTFMGCSGLTSIGIPNSVASIGNNTFLGCSGLTSIGIPNNVTSIGSSAFSDCTSLISIEFPNSVTSIGQGAFNNTAWYNNQPDGVVYAGKVAYTYKGTMPMNTSIILKDGTTGISDYIFSGCTGLTSVEIPNSVTSIGVGAFYGCRNLASLSIGSGVKIIGRESFNYCENLSYVNIYDIAAWCNIDFGDNPLSYSHCLYLNNEKVINLVIPDGISKIQGAFRYCTDFTSIKVCCNRPPVIDISQFASTDKTTCTLYVPKGTAMMYMSATGWNEFANIIEYEDGDAHYITIRMGDGGELQQSVELGKIYIYKVKADEGWTVSTLTFNGEDITSQLLDGQFSTPVITGDAELNVVFKQEASNIKSMKQTDTSKVKVYAYNGTVKVAGAEDGTEVEVYNAGGILVANGEGNCSILLDSGIYIVKVGNETFKVSL